MLERHLVQNRGVRNVRAADGTTTGFQLRLRNPNYRGVAGSLVDGVDVVVDGERFDREVVRWTLQGRDLSIAELRASTDVRWQLDEAAVVTVPKPGGLAPGVHDVEVTIALHAPYIPAQFQPSLFPARRSVTVVPEAAPIPGQGGLQYGVSLYSYTDDIFTVLTLDDAMAEIADLGATGIEILGEGDVTGYPEPSSAWLDAWYAGLERHGLTPTNYGSWIDSRMWRDRDLTAAEGAAQLARDLRLAHRLGFTSVRPKIGVVSMELAPHPIWEEVVERNLDLAAGLGVVIAPEVHAPTPIKHPVVDKYIAFIERTGTKHFGLLLDTGVFQTTSYVEGHAGLSEEASDHGWRRPLAVPMADLVDVLPHTVFIQAKFFEVDDSLTDPHIPWRDVVTTLVEHGYSGYLSSEYEGRRSPYRSLEQVRRQHALLRGLEAEARAALA